MKNMDIEILQQPESAIARVTLKASEKIVAEAGAMIAMSDRMEANTTLRTGKSGGVMAGLKRMLGRESLFLSEFNSPNAVGEIFLAPKFLGDIVHYQMATTGLIVQAGSYLASSPDVDITVGFQGFKSFFSGESILWLEMNGSGDLLLSSFGAIYEKEIDGEYMVDTGHIVAFEKTLDFEITKAGSSWLSSFLGGEGLVCRFKGRGKLFCQTHNVTAFGQLIGSQLPPR